MKNTEYVSDEKESFAEELPRRIIIKFKEGVINLPYEDNAEKYFDEKNRERWEELKKAFPEITLQRVFISVEPAAIKELTARAEKLDPTYEPVDFLTFFMIELSPGVDPFALVEVLNTWDIVEYAYVESLPAPLPALPTGSNPSLPLRRYLEPPQYGIPGATNIGGIDALYVWGNFSAGINAGNGIKFIDVEKGWNLDHQDLSSASITLVGGVSRDEFRHGTNVLGIVAAQDNAWGGVGIAYKSIGQVVSGWANMTDTLPRWHDAIMTSANNLNFGDVLLLEAQIQPVATELPLELESTNFVVIRLATALGIIVVEAAGNGSALLDDQVDNNGQHILNKTSPDFRDSGAILVGAANTWGDKGGRRATSNYGCRVNCFAWGNNVTTTDTNASGTDDTLADRNDFSATSAASAIIAGAAILLQGIAKEPAPTGLDFRLNAFQMRNILSDKTPGTNTLSADPTTDRIGVMPNLHNIIVNVLNLTPDVVVRDHIGDTGAPHTGDISSSPDVIVRPASGTGSIPRFSPDTQPQAEFGGSTTMGDPTLSRDILTGDQDIFVRVFNQGGATANDVQATVYWSLPGTHLLRPDQWTKIVSSIPVPPINVSPGISSMTVLSRIRWHSGIPGPGHYCFIATVGGPKDPDPLPDPAALVDPASPNPLTFDQFYDLIRRNNNITWKNFNVLGMTTLSLDRPTILEFFAPGAFDIDRLMRLEIVAHLPQGAKLWLDGPADFINAMLKGNFEKKTDERMRLPLNPYGVNRFREMLFPAKSQNPLRLFIDIPEQQRTGTHDVYVQHLYKSEEIGRITWHFVPQIRNDGDTLSDYLRRLFARISPWSCLLYLLIVLAALTIIYVLLFK